MKLKALIWNRYRSFKERQKVELAPLTVIIGKNGSGKSVISRLPLILASGVSNASQSPIDLMAGGVEHAAQYQDLVNMRGALPFTLGCEVAGKYGSFEFETTLRHISETKSLVVEKFELRENGVDQVKIEITDVEQLAEASPRYSYWTVANQEEARAIQFSGLLPRVASMVDGDREAFSKAAQYFREALEGASYLGPFRAEPDVSTKAPGQDIRNLGPRGERATEFLADDKLRHGGAVGKDVGAWFAGVLGQSVSVDTNGIRPQIAVTDQTTGLQVGLADTGAGLSQALPIVLQNFAARAQRLPAPLLIVEQPELHLHPGAHGDLSDLVLETAIGGSNHGGIPCMIETHSEQFIMRIRRRIAERVAPDKVVLWSLNHKETAEQPAPETLRIIPFDQKGDPGAWPVGVFEEAFGDLAKMREAARSQAK
ncbi:AAA family ATPase [Bradyrhizobium manausense]|uniref:AAA family ATPase n=1 Tax=Bradyrhizobium manausense TaxID=989370 RepID=UPI001BA6575B|nr:AAA family ATPase [Bradyrhizobium manausense]MBR0831935.1 AAA family ATPase [Bradyrhizobium manausense]